MQKKEFTAEDKKFLGDTPFRWIRISSVSYEDSELTPELREQLEMKGYVVCRKGAYTTEFCKGYKG